MRAGNAKQIFIVSSIEKIWPPIAHRAAFKDYAIPLSAGQSGACTDHGGAAGVYIAL
jgi:hypothetical protein